MGTMDKGRRGRGNRNGKTNERDNRNGKANERDRSKFKGRKVDEIREIENLDARIRAGAPLSGTNPLATELPKDVSSTGGAHLLVPYVGAKLFDQLPISDRSKRGLRDAKYTRMTAIQRAAIPHCLCGRDVLGAAKTGSGKTLAFLLPVIEKLYRLKWSADDGLGSIIISPTRELAFQIFEELRKVGKHHSLSAGLLIGGRKDVETEKQHVGRLNVLVCTPGRLLQHMDESPSFDASQLQVLVLDEADRILDMGFAGTLNAIVGQLSKERQTFLFSATQTKSVQDLARLSLVDPEYLAVHAESNVATPVRLHQSAMIVPLNEKLDMLWSFVKTHLRFKILVFLSSCKQVKFIHQVFKKLRPGIPVKCLHGRMKQTQRSIVFDEFCQTKHTLLFSTDVAARGLDFPSVDWVVQVDCPEDVPTYIHRVGRTARYTASGRSLLFLVPSEQSMLTALESSKIPVNVIKPNKSRILSVSGTLAGLLSKDTALKYLAQRAFITYLRSIHLHSNKEVFDVTKLPLAEFALSLGLPTTPRVRFLKKGTHAKDSAGSPQEFDNASNNDDDDEALLEDGEDTAAAVTAKEDQEEIVRQKDGKASKLDRLFKRKNADVLSAAHEKNRASRNKSSRDGSVDSDEEFLTKKRPRLDTESVGEAQQKTKSSGVKVLKNKKLKIDPGCSGSQRLVFDDAGNALPPLAALAGGEDVDRRNSTGSKDKIEEIAGERFKHVKEEMKRRDKEDRLLEKERLRQKRLKRKQTARDASPELEHDGHPSLGPEYSSGEEGSDFGANDREGHGGDGASNQDLSSSDSDQKHSQRHSRKSKPRRAHKGPEIAELSIAEQEALALKLLGSRS